MLHIAAPFSVSMELHGIKWWWVGNIFNSATRWSVPVLILITGKLMLDNKREEEIFTFLRKRLVKVVIPLVAWSFIYILLVNKLNIEWGSQFVLSFLKKLYLGNVHIHLWYLYMIVGLYLITPIIKPYINNVKKDNLIYFIVIWFIANGIIGFSEKFTGYSLAFNLSFFHWSIGYFILGFILGKYDLSKVQEGIIYILGFLGLVATIYGSYLITKFNNGIIIDHGYSYYAPNVIFTSVAVFLMGKKIDWYKLIGDNKLINKIIKSLSSTSFGIYLVHLLVLRVISSGYLGITINPASFNPVLSIPLVSIITFIISHFIVVILQKIPLLKMIVPK